MGWPSSTVDQASGLLLTTGVTVICSFAITSASLGVVPFS